MRASGRITGSTALCSLPRDASMSHSGCSGDHAGISALRAPLCIQDARAEVCALVVTYKPNGRTLDHCREIAEQVANMVIVDNGSGESVVAQLRHIETSVPVRVIANPINVGIGAALNQGFEAAIELGFAWVLTFDQDSAPGPEMVAELVATLNRYAECSSIAMVGPDVIEENIPDTPYRFLRPFKCLPGAFRKSPVGKEDLTDVTAIITSGALTSVEAYEHLGPFRDDFFMDYVDTEFCLRARRMGYTVLVSARAKLLHNFGNRRAKRLLGVRFRPTFHPPSRLYYVFRNRIIMMRMYALSFPHFLVFDLVAGFFNLVRVLAFEDCRAAKVHACVLGTLDGIRGRSGAAPEELVGE